LNLDLVRTPEWVKSYNSADHVNTKQDAALLEAIAELADEVSIGERQIHEHLYRLVERGVVTAEYEGRGYVWRDDGLYRLSEHGEVELEPVDVDNLDAAQVAEVGRNVAICGMS